MAGYNGAGAAVPGAWARGNEQSEVFDTLFYMYNGALPTITAPTITSPLGLAINGQFGPQNINLQLAQQYTAQIAAADTNNPPLPLGYQWMIIPIPSNGPTDHSTYAPVDGAGAAWTATSTNWPIVSQDTGGGCVFNAPTTPGQYRLTVWVYNMLQGTPYKFATHNAPFTVSNTPSSYVYSVTADSYVQGPNTTGNGATIQAFSQQAFGGAQQLLANSFASTKALNYFPYLFFNLAGAFGPSASNPPQQVLLNVFSLSGQMPYYNLSVYPVNAPSTWTEGGLSFASLNPQLTAANQWTASAAYNFPYSPGLGGASSCATLATTPAGITACAPLSTVSVSGGTPGYASLDVTSYVAAQVLNGATSVDFALSVSCFGTTPGNAYFGLQGPCSPLVYFASREYSGGA